MIVNFTFGPAAYTPPALGGVNFAFPETVAEPTAKGFQSTKFGTHSTTLAVAGIAPTSGVGTPYTKVVQVPSGFAVVAQFGTPLGPGYFAASTIGKMVQLGSHIGPNITFAQGFALTEFGTPRGPNNAFPSPVTDGIKLGTPSIPLQHIGWLATRFGTAKAIYRQVCEASGWVTANVPEGAMGYTSITYEPGVNAQPHGWITTEFGQAAGSWSQEGQAAWGDVTNFGSPSAGIGNLASGFFSTAAGAPTSSFTAKAHSFRSVMLGVAASATAHIAQGMPPRIRFGNARINTPCAHQAFGLNAPGRFGMPRLRIQAPLLARGLRAGGRFGQPRTGCHL